MRRFVMCMAMTAALGLTSQAHADTGYVRIVGAKQGEIKGGMTPKAWANQNEVIDIAWGLSVPASSTGMATGRRQHDPLVLTLKWTRATPLLLQAATSNETLTSVVYSDVAPDANGDGSEQLRHTLSLTNARIVGLRIVDHNGADRGLEPLVVVTLSYQKLTLTDADGGISADDDTGPQ